MSLLSNKERNVNSLKTGLCIEKCRELVPEMEPVLEIMDSVVRALANNKLSWQCLFPLL